MTPNAINQAMAELEGWEVKSQGSHMTYPWCMYRNGALYGAGWRSEDAAWINIPGNYTEDLNAVARVVGKINTVERRLYRECLTHMCAGILYIADATATPRCEAVLRACGKWVEE